MGCRRRRGRRRLRRRTIRPLQQHYARTLAIWSTRLQEKKDQAIAIASPEVYNTCVKYLSGCVHYFRKGYIDVMQFSLFKQQPHSAQQ